MKTKNNNKIDPDKQDKQDQCYFSLKDILPYKLH
jgi:hypothetical protein